MPFSFFSCLLTSPKARAPRNHSREDLHRCNKTETLREILAKDPASSLDADRGRHRRLGWVCARGPFSQLTHVSTTPQPNDPSQELVQGKGPQKCKPPSSRRLRRRSARHRDWQPARGDPAEPSARRQNQTWHLNGDVRHSFQVMARSSLQHLIRCTPLGAIRRLRW